MGTFLKSSQGDILTESRHLDKDTLTFPDLSAKFIRIVAGWLEHYFFWAETAPKNGAEARNSRLITST
jgi:hypothetical protein